MSGWALRKLKMCEEEVTNLKSGVKGCERERWGTSDFRTFYRAPPLTYLGAECL